MGVRLASLPPPKRKEAIPEPIARLRAASISATMTALAPWRPPSPLIASWRKSSCTHPPGMIHYDLLHSPSCETSGRREPYREAWFVPGGRIFGESRTILEARSCRSFLRLSTRSTRAVPRRRSSPSDAAFQAPPLSEGRARGWGARRRDRRRTRRGRCRVGSDRSLHLIPPLRG